RRLQRTSVLQHLPARPPRRPALHRRRPQGALLQEVRRRPGLPQQEAPREIREQVDSRIGRFIVPLPVESRAMARLLDRYQKEIVPDLSQKLGRANKLSLPRLQKVVVNMGVGKALQDRNRMEQAAEQLALITGQKAQVTKAKRAVSGFRLREGNEIGCRVTLRGPRM